jgi:hypothetical protein
MSTLENDPYTLDEALMLAQPKKRVQCSVCIALSSLDPGVPGGKPGDRERLDHLYAEGKLRGRQYGRVLALMGHKVADDSIRRHYLNENGTHTS